MYIYKYQLDEYLHCPYYFAFNIINKSNKTDISSKTLIDVLNKVAASKTSRSMDRESKDKDILWLRNTISKFALQEMESGKKLALHDYRIMYTNKYFKNYFHNNSIDGNVIINKLNNMLSVFSDNIFIGYNVPIEVPIQKTNIIFRDIVDFIMVDPFDQDKITVVELADLSTFINKNKYTEWIHYKIQYSFLASSIEKDITVKIIDPFYSDNILEFTYKKDSFSKLYETAVQFIPKILDPILFKNLLNCNSCNIKEECFKEI
jgi:hypothetical protein